MSINIQNVNNANRNSDADNTSQGRYSAASGKRRNSMNRAAASLMNVFSASKKKEPINNVMSD